MIVARLDAMDLSNLSAPGETLDVEISGRKAFWREIGASWAAKGGHIRLKLDALPPDGVIMMLREPINSDVVQGGCFCGGDVRSDACTPKGRFGRGAPSLAGLPVGRSIRSIWCRKWRGGSRHHRR